MDLTATEWRDSLILSREFATPGERTDFFARTRSGEFVAIYRGVYMPAAQWAALDESACYRTRVMAAAAFAGRELVFSHHSAAALWRLPWVGEWPRQAHVVEPLAAGGRSNGMLARHTVGVPEDIAHIDGLVATSLARTVVDLARAASFASAVTIADADAALRRTQYPFSGLPHSALTHEDLFRQLDNVPPKQGSVKVRKVIEFANGAADRPGESLSRVNIRAAGLTMPQLQVTITGASGCSWTVDFWWPEFNVIGEFDGKFKYTDPEFLKGRTPAQAVYEEKLREDDLRAAGHGMSRWSWPIAISPRLLREHLVAAGVR